MTSRRLRTTAVAATGIVSMLAVGSFIAAPATATPVVAAPATGVFLEPYYTALDLTADKQVTSADLKVVADHLGETSADGWSAFATADVDADGTITLADLALVSGRMIYDDGPFTLVEATTIDMQAAMNAGVTTSVKLTQAYLDRIAAYDRVDSDGTGTAVRALNSIISTNSTALDAAAVADATRASSGMTSMLLGVPIAVKDNYDTSDMPTTAGCGCWDNNQTSDDAFMVKGLRAAGAVILAKASLDEFALGFASEFSSFQDAGKSLLVASPYNTTKTAGGSSGGTGASISANLAAIGFGTDTGGSIRVPSSYNQLVGIRPTVGLTSRDGIVPLALSQDTGGPIARSVTDAAVALDAVVGVDPNDAATSKQTGLVPTSYTAYLDPTALAGKRIGFMQSIVGTNTTVLRLWNAAKATLIAQGATVVEITAPDTTELTRVMAEGSGSTTEFKHDLAIYTATHLATVVPYRSLRQIIDSGRMVPGRTGTYNPRDLITDTQYQNWAGPTGSHTTFIANANTSVTAIMDRLTLDSIVYPSAGQYTTIGSNLRLSPNTGLPAVTVPMGQSITGETGAVAGAGVNLEFLGRNFSEGPLIGLTYSFEQASKLRTTPALFPALGAATP